MERPFRVTIPDGTATSFSYDFGSDREGRTQLRTTVTDATGEVAPREVLATISTLHEHDVRLLTLEGDAGNSSAIITSDEHPFYVQGKGWVEAGRLKVGDKVATLDGKVLAVVGSQRQQDGLLMHNLTVDEFHTYSVTEERVWVHNCKGETRRGGPAPNGGNAKPHGNANHNSAIDERVDQLKKDPSVSNIRKNQQQVDVDGNKVGTNRPDIQYDQGGCHHCVEYDHVPRNSTRHGDQVRANDPDAQVELNLL